MLMGESTSINWNKSATDSKIRLLSPPWQPLIRHLLKNRKMDCDSEHSGKDASSSMSSKCLGLDKCTIIGVTHPAKNCDHQAKHSFPVLLPFCALTRGVVVKISRRHLSSQCASSSPLSPEQLHPALFRWNAPDPRCGCHEQEISLLATKGSDLLLL